MPQAEGIADPASMKFRIAMAATRSNRQISLRPGRGEVVDTKSCRAGKLCAKISQLCESASMIQTDRRRNARAHGQTRGARNRVRKGRLMVSSISVLAPGGISPPFARYAHGVMVPAGARLAVTSGQLALAAGGSVPSGAQAQAARCFAQCAAILAEAGMGPADVIRINAFVTDRAHMAGYMAARDAWLAGVARLPASTLVIVAGFTRPAFLVEVEVTAAQV